MNIMEMICPKMRMHLCFRFNNFSMLYVKSRVGIMYQNKVDNVFEFLKTHPSILSWTDFGETIVNGM